MQTHEWDQTQAGLRDAARVVASYYQALRSEGLGRREALALAGAFQALVLSGAMAGEEG